MKKEILSCLMALSVSLSLQAQSQTKKTVAKSAKTVTPAKTVAPATATQPDTDAPKVLTTDPTPDQLKTEIEKDENGKLYRKFTYYTDDAGHKIKHGDYTQYYPNGQKERVCTYRHGRPDGRQTWYYSNGNIWMDFSTKMGVRDGAYQEFHRDGRMKFLKIYRNGKVIRGRGRAKKR